MPAQHAVRHVGITGHSDLTAPSLALVERALRVALARPAAAGLVGVSCLAQGADQVFADVVLGLGGRLEVVLPARDYRVAKVCHDNRAVFDRLLAQAAVVRLSPFDHSCREAYMAASEAMLASVHEVVAVWDRRPATRYGSTADVVAAARRLGLPVSIVWPDGAARAPRLVRSAAGTASATRTASPTGTAGTSPLP